MCKYYSDLQLCLARKPSLCAPKTSGPSGLFLPPEQPDCRARRWALLTVVSNYVPDVLNSNRLEVRN